jgi:hypothetical protein
MAPEWKDSADQFHAAACSDDCRITDTVYRDCSQASQRCWPGSFYFCIVTGVCTRLCSSDADCYTINTLATCHKDANGGSCVPPCGRCQPGLCCQSYGTEIPHICGWQSFDPATMMITPSPDGSTCTDPHPGLP